MMQVYIWVLATITFFGSSLIPFSNVSIAQNTALAPLYIDRAMYKAAQEGLICSQETIENVDPSERDARKEACGIELEIKTKTKTKTETEAGQEQPLTADADTQTSASEPNGTVVNSEGEEVSLIPDPEVSFVEDYMVKFDGNRDTIFLGGVVPFVALPDSELITDDRFFNEESFSLFFYLKRKF